MYKITVKRTAAKELNSLPNRIKLAVTEAIFKLADDPKPNGCKKLKGKVLEIWRIRIGDYRVLYTIDDKIKIIDIKKVGHRKDIYE
jgi:mRNA interferase RelE/StbE